MIRGSIRRNTVRIHSITRSNADLKSGGGSSPSANNLLPSQQQLPGEEEGEEDSRLVMFVDSILPECGKTLDEFIAASNITSEEETLRMVTRGFRIFDNIANTLCKMHRAGFSYRVLRPNMVRILGGPSKTFTVFLDSPDYIWDVKESEYLTKHILSETDFMNYDCKCLASLILYYFLAVQTRASGINPRRGERLSSLG